MKFFNMFFMAILFASLTACNTTDQKKSIAKDSTASNDSNAVKLQLVTGAINEPVQMNVAPGEPHRLFITDLSGKIWMVENDSVSPKPFLDIAGKLEQKDTSAEIRGMFSMAFHPQFATNGKFYVCYNAPTKIKDNVCKLVVSEFTRSSNDPNTADTNTEHRVFEMEGKGVEMLASQIAFGPDGYLYISIGDHGNSAYKFRAQDLSCFNGKLLRIDVNKLPYSIPADNPFVGIKNERPEIWASGFRRLWRFSFDQQTKQLIGGDVGEAKQEEVDIIKKGADYGWPEKEGDSMFDVKDQFKNTSFTEPIATYSHKEGICVIGGDYYYGDSIPFLKGKYVFADFNGGLFTLTKHTQGEWIRESLQVLDKPKDPLLICSLNTDENNEMYVMGLLNTNAGFKGMIYKIVSR